MFLVNKYTVVVLSAVIALSFKLDKKEVIRYEVIRYYTYDYKWGIWFFDYGGYAKYEFIGDMGAIKDNGIYQLDDSTITIIRTKSSARLEGYPYRDTIVIPNKDTITVDGLKYYKQGGLIKPPKIKRKRRKSSW